MVAEQWSVVSRMLSGARSVAEGGFRLRLCRRGMQAVLSCDAVRQSLPAALLGPVRAVTRRPFFLLPAGPSDSTLAWCRRGPGGALGCDGAGFPLWARVGSGRDRADRACAHERTWSEEGAHRRARAHPTFVARFRIASLPTEPISPPVPSGLRAVWGRVGRRPCEHPAMGGRGSRRLAPQPITGP